MAKVTNCVVSAAPCATSTGPIGLGADGEQVVVRVGRYGPYLQRGEDRASIPDDLPPDELSVERAEELLAAPSGDRTLGIDPATGLPVLVRSGRFGPYVNHGKINATLKKGMSEETITLEEAIRLIEDKAGAGTSPRSPKKKAAVPAKRAAAKKVPQKQAAKPATKPAAAKSKKARQA